MDGVVYAACSDGVVLLFLAKFGELASKGPVQLFITKKQDKERE